jgi:hypothetical protein
MSCGLPLVNLREATVVTPYLLPRLNLQLRPTLLSDLRPGTRVVSHAFAMEDWRPDQELRVPGPSSQHHVYYWVIPADVAGLWRWRVPTQSGELRYTLRLQQRFQEVDGTLSTDGEEVPVANTSLVGEQLSFSAAGRQTTMWFAGRVSGHTMQGRMEVQGRVSAGQCNWMAHRDATGATPTHDR